MRKITIEDVAAKAGVSVSTVSRVLNNNPKVDKALSSRVQETIDALGYVPNAGARYIRSGASDLISMIIPSPSNQFFAQILEGAMDTALEHEYKIIAYSSDGSEQKDIKCLHSVASSPSSGLIYCPISVASTEHLNVVLSKKLPVVIAARRATMKGLPHVYVDNVKGCYTATRFLLVQGRRNIAFFAGFWEKPANDVEGLLDIFYSEKKGAYSSLDRLEGYMEALKEFGVEFKSSLLHMTEYDYAGGYKAVKEFLPKMVEFDAVICSNDWVASGVLQALQEQNISVPEDVSIIGYDNAQVAPISRPTLSTVQQLPHKIGNYAVESLIDLIEGKKVEDKIVETSLIVRNSTAVKNKTTYR